MTTPQPILKPCECCGEHVPDTEACDEWGQMWDDRPAPAGDHRYCHACFTDTCDCDRSASNAEPALRKDPDDQH